MALRITGQCIRSNEMQRRNFLKIIAGAVALGLSPALLNVTRLQVTGTVRRAFTFPLGLTRNITEIGIGSHKGGILMHQILPQMVTVLDDEALTLEYEINPEDENAEVVAWSVEEDGKTQFTRIAVR